MTQMRQSLYRLLVPRVNFFTLRFLEPRAYSRAFLGACFLREVRLAVLRSSRLSVFVFAISPQKRALKAREL